LRIRIDGGLADRQLDHRLAPRTRLSAAQMDFPLLRSEVGETIRYRRVTHVNLPASTAQKLDAQQAFDGTEADPDLRGCDTAFNAVCPCALA
jgi:hypothetical protein